MRCSRYLINSLTLVRLINRTTNTVVDFAEVTRLIDRGPVIALIFSTFMEKGKDMWRFFISLRDLINIVLIIEKPKVINNTDTDPKFILVVTQLVLS